MCILKYLAMHESAYSYQFTSLQRLRYYPFPFNLNRCVGSCNTLNDESNRIRVPNQTESLNLYIFKMIREIN